MKTFVTSYTLKFSIELRGMEYIVEYLFHCSYINTIVNCTYQPIM
jgi:hypothetical protein